MVPRVPTLEMISAVDEYVGGHCFSCTPDKASEYDCRRVYDAMISVAPQPEQADAFGLLHNRVHADPGGSRAANVVRSEQPEQAQYSRPVCRGSWALGSACGKCERCEHTKPEQAQQSGWDGVTGMPTDDVFVEVAKTWPLDWGRIKAIFIQVQRRAGQPPKQPTPRPVPTSEWLPIESCPEDSMFLACNANDYTFIELLSWQGDGCVWNYGSNNMQEIKHYTHWIPLPEPPTGLTRPAEPVREVSPEFKQAAWDALKCSGKKVACAKKAGPAEPDGGAV